MLKILDINKFINQHKALQVTQVNSFDKNGPTNSGLYSPRIFGITNDEKRTRFGYISLNTNVIHPAAFDAIIKLSPDFKYCILNEKSYIIEEGKLVKDDNGKSGVDWLYHNFKKIDFDKYIKPGVEDIVEFFKTTNVFIDKFLVIPTIYRNYVEKHGLIEEDEITGLYKKLLVRTIAGQLDADYLDQMMQQSSKATIVQRMILELYKYFITILEKKDGKFRGELISKRIDNNVRLVANARPDIPFNCIGLPWHVLINVFDVYVISVLTKNNLSKDYAELLKIKSFSINELGEHFDYIYRNSDTYTLNNSGLRETWVELLKEMLEVYKDLRVLTKRDPAWDKGSYHTLKPIIIPTNSYHVVVNSLLYKPLGGDSFSTRFTCIETECENIHYPSEKQYIIRGMDKIYE